MLFIHPAIRGKGIGTVLLNFAVEELGANKVDVNEANGQAVGFYQHSELMAALHTTVPENLVPFFM